MRKTFAIGAITFLAAACGGETLDVGGSNMGTGGGPLNDGGGATDDVPPGPTNSTVILTLQPGAWYLALHRGYLYWVTNDDGFAMTRRCRTDDCPNTVEDVLRGAWSVQFLGDDMYFGLIGTTKIVSCPTSGCTTPKTVVTGAEVESMRVDSSGIYWSTRLDTSIYTCPLSGCDSPARAVVSGVRAYDLHSDETRIYYLAAAGSGISTFDIVSAPKDGSSPPTVIASGLKKPSTPRIFDGFVYWSSWEAKGYVARCPLSGCIDGKPEILASDQTYPLNVEPSGDSVFWLNENAGLSAQNKPATIHGCKVSDCGSTLALFDYAAGRAATNSIRTSVFMPQNLVADSDAVYYVADLSQGASEAGLPVVANCAIRRLARSPGH